MQTTVKFKHPEIQPGEKFYMNVKVNVQAEAVNFVKTSHPKFIARAGMKAYTPNGVEVPGYVPIFMSKKQA